MTAKKSTPPTLSEQRRARAAASAAERATRPIPTEGGSWIELPDGKLERAPDDRPAPVEQVLKDD